MTYTRYKIRIWEWDGEATTAHTVVFKSFSEAKARFNILHVSEKIPQIELVKERIAQENIIDDKILDIRKFLSVFELLTKDKHTLATFLCSLPVIEAPWDISFQKRYCSSCKAENCDICPNEHFRNNPEWWLSLPEEDIKL